jgi:hypothetical protein
MMTEANKTYQIRLKGHLNESWADWFEGLTFAHKSNGTTTLTGEVVDQAALHGMLRTIRDLGLPLLSVNQVKPGQPDSTEAENKNAMEKPQ